MLKTDSVGESLPIQVSQLETQDKPPKALVTLWLTILFVSICVVCHSFGHDTVEPKIDLVSHLTKALELYVANQLFIISDLDLRSRRPQKML